MKKLNASLLTFLILIALIVAAFTLKSEHFLTVNNLMKAFKHLSVTAISALGLTYVIIVGKSDMSFHFLSCFGAMTMSYLIGIGQSPFIAISVALLSVALVGFLNGYLVGHLDFPDMVATIGIGSAMFGFAYIYSGGRYIYRNFFESGIMEIHNAELFGVLPLPAFFMICLYFLSWALLHKTIYGRKFYAVGGNPVAARFSGINVSKYIIIAFIVCAMFSTFTNIIQVASQGKGEIRAGIPLLMPTWAAVFVGISVFKKPTVYGTFLGAFLISIMQNGFTLLSVPFFYMDFIVGMTLIISIMIANADVLTAVFQRFRRVQHS